MSLVQRTGEFDARLILESVGVNNLLPIKFQVTKILFCVLLSSFPSCFHLFLFDVPSLVSTSLSVIFHSKIPLLDEHKFSHQAQQSYGPLESPHADLYTSAILIPHLILFAFTVGS